jgi:hypothetical protein
MGAPFLWGGNRIGKAFGITIEAVGIDYVV